jgi:probable rRNA maturation factor
MRVSLEYTEEVTTPFDTAFFVRVAEETLKRCPLRGLDAKEIISMNVVAVAKEKIQELNKTYRNKDSVTDILSFGDYPDTASVENDSQSHIFLGEIFFCLDDIVEAATEDALSLSHEMTYVFSHGVLHLLGYDHCDEMFALQDAVTEELVRAV